MEGELNKIKCITMHINNDLITMVFNNVKRI